MNTEPRLIGENLDFRKIWADAGLLDPNTQPIEAKPFDVSEYVRKQRMERFKQFCPTEFQQAIKPDLIEDPAAWEKADAWNGTHKGIWIWSHATGLAKSRMLWRKYGQLHVKQAKTVCRITGFNLAEAYHDAVNQSKTASFYYGLLGFDVIMLDDLDKMLLPEEGLGFKEQESAGRNARMLRELFDRFYERHMPVLVTANEPIEWFTQRCGPSTGRRMTEVCTEIAFTPSKTF
jgi:hypothetical protein